MDWWPLAAAAVIGGGLFLVALRLWGARIVAGLAGMALKAAFEALKRDRKTPEEYERLNADRRAGIERDRRGRERQR